MSYLKFSATQLFDGIHLHDDRRVLIITTDGTVQDIVPHDEAGDDIQELEGILSPGFVNCHCHLELSHLRGRIPRHTGLVDFVGRVMKDRQSPEQEIFAAIDAAETQMLDNGIVAVGDICNNILSVDQKKKGRIWYHNFIEASGFSPSVQSSRFKIAIDHFREFGKNYAIPVESNSIVPHAPYSDSDELFKAIVHFPGNRLMTIHNQESPDENELFRENKGGFLDLYRNFGIDASHFEASGKTSLQTFLGKFLPHQPVILVHNVCTSPEDLQFCKEMLPDQVRYWCLCPNANQYISATLPPVDMLVSEGCDIVLGTDSLASNDTLSILSEMQTIRRHFPLIPTWQLLRWATSNGARALQLDSILGSFEKGKKPGVILCGSDLAQVTRLL